MGMNPILTHHMHKSYRHFAAAAELHLNHLPRKFKVDSASHKNIRLHEYQQTRYHAYPQSYIAQQQYQLYRQQNRYLHNHSHHHLPYAAHQIDCSNRSSSPQTPVFMPGREKFLINNLGKHCRNLWKNDLRSPPIITSSSTTEKDEKQYIPFKPADGENILSDALHQTEERVKELSKENSNLDLRENAVANEVDAEQNNAILSNKGQQLERECSKKL
ncbi:uncharacterized protein LOC118745562 [Rhagoletis pomonella]|uniref:uncharacterized protein LOC118745562 n=1 Tax=Rhagoletis pomonella TaxID=28610 RepID=UPI00177E1593|nr:uncharacterized protein LOC118745562 [Rhagoletis pomonella]